MLWGVPRCRVVTGDLPRDFAVDGPQGRKLQVLETGDPKGRPVVTLHGTPMSRLIFARHSADASAHGVRLIGFDRPGYGRSTPSPGFRIADTATDVRAIAEALDIPRLAVWGVSGGGAPALACAALLADRVVAVASLSALAPYPSVGWDWFEGMADGNADDFRFLLDDREEWTRRSLADWKATRAQGPDDLRTALYSLCSETDRRAFSDELADYFSMSRSEALAQSPEGWMGDSIAQLSPWGFDPLSIQVPVQVWHGEEDRFVPAAHGRWLGAHVPGAETRIQPNEGHLSIFTERVPEIHRWLASHF